MNENSRPLLAIVDYIRVPWSYYKASPFHSDCLPQTFCHLLYQRQKTGTGYTKDPFKTTSLDLLDYSYKIIMVGRNLT